MLAARIHPAAIQILRDLLDDPAQIERAANGFGQEHHLGADGFGGFDHTAALDLPTAGDHEPMHDEQSEQLGIKVAQHMPGLLAAREIGVAILLPEFKEQFKKSLRLPAL